MTRWLLVPLLLAAPGLAQPAKAPPKTPWANKLFLTDILKDPTQESPANVTHDFGTVPANTLCSHTFTFTNIYDVPLQVVDVRVECGCLKAYPPNKVLQPNEQAEFTVTMNAALFKGAATKKMFVTVGPGHVSTAELRFAATSREDVALSAPGMIDFGNVAQGSKSEKTLTLKYTGAKADWKVESAAVVGAAYTAEVTEAARGFLSTDYKITVNLKDTAPAGPVGGSVVLKTNDPAHPLVTVAVGGSVRPPVEVAPGRVVFDANKPGVPQTAIVAVRTAAACQLTGLTDDGDGVSVEVFPRASELHRVTVRYEAKKAGEFRKEVKVKTDLPGNPEAVIVVEVR